MIIYLVIMIRTQIQLKEEQYQALRKRSVEVHHSIAHQIREAVDRYLRAEARPRVNRLREVAGKYSPGEFAQSKPHDRQYARSIRTSRSDSPKSTAVLDSISPQSAKEKRGSGAQ